MARTPASEPKLIRRARGGEVAAFEALYRAHVGRVNGLCLRLTADRARAEDLTQEVFVTAWQKLSTFRGDSAFSTWLHRLAVNRVVSALRLRRGGEEREVRPDEAPAAAGRAALPTAGARLDLERAIRALPPRARAVFVLHDVEGYGHGEIAGLTGIALGTSKAHLHRARKLLREALR